MGTLGTLPDSMPPLTTESLVPVIVINSLGDATLEPGWGEQRDALLKAEKPRSSPTRVQTALPLSRPSRMRTEWYARHSSSKPHARVS